MLAKIPAVVLSYDHNRPLANHMIACYEKLWPKNPFIFYIPYQLKHEENTSKCTYIKSPLAIKGTVLELLSNFSDNEWIYWCIDDKYPIKFDIEIMKAVIHWIQFENNSDISGLLLCRTRRLLDPNNLNARTLKIGEYNFLERKTYHQMWIHQFFRVKVIRSIFERFPEVIPKAKDMDAYQDSLLICPDHQIFVVEKNTAVFGESTVNGKITKNCFESINQKNMAISENLTKNIHPYTIIIGELSF
jgi:hypothetical protein